LTADSGGFTLVFDDPGSLGSSKEKMPTGVRHTKVGHESRPLRRSNRMATVSLTVNGQSVTADVDPRTLLVQFLRENLRLTGTHVGCDTSQCGACVVHLNGQAVKSCTVLAVQAEACVVTTIEGLARDGDLHPMQAAFREHHGLQCGFCTPGMIMAAVDIVNRKGSALDEKTIRSELEGNLCRCTGYHNIVKAVAAGAQAMTAAPVRQAAE
jgi:carbon-monoxide dehydrogenase small subunit